MYNRRGCYSCKIEACSSHSKEVIIQPLACCIFLISVYTDPWISCPIDRVEDLEPHKSTVVLGYKWQLPRTNMKNVTVSPSDYNENYPFPVGRHRVTWIATSDSGTQKSCSLHITVNGEFSSNHFCEWRGCTVYPSIFNTSGNPIS